jgi:signal transduction histidine kinase/CheY-like chemotaxis protein
VTAANAFLMAGVLVAAGQGRGAYAWLALSILVAAARLAVWRIYRRGAPERDQYERWSLASTCGASAAGLLWGGGSFLLFPEGEIYQLFWVFLIAGMCAGAVALHYAHLPSALAFILPAGLPLAIRFALEGGERSAAAAAMIAVFLAALVVTVHRSSRYFGETLQLRIDLAERTHELAASNAMLRQEIAERRATQASLHHAQKIEAVGQLTGGIAHDFNNLLTVVLGSLELLRKRLPPEDPKAFRLLDHAVQGAQRGAALTQRLLAFGRRQALRPEIVHLPALIEGMSTLLRSSLGSGVQIHLLLPEALPPVEVDPNQLELALLNLAVNARDAMPDGGRLTVTARREWLASARDGGLPPGSYVLLRVVDTGQGMDEATLARAMEPFFTTKGVGKGTGLGLAMVHGFAAQSGGRLVLQSTPGSGTVAELWLPQADVAAPSTLPASVGPDPTAPMPIRRLAVLVVDDDPLVLASTAGMLEDLGHLSVEAESGPEALAILRGGRSFDLVVTDYAMPGMTGLQLTEELHRQWPRLPVVLATGYAELQETTPNRLTRLAKPFGQEALAEAIEACLHVGATQETLTRDPTV